MLRVWNVLFTDEYGGPHNRIIQVGQELQKRGVDTTLCIPVGDGNAEAKAMRDGIKVVRVPFIRVPRLTNLRRLGDWLARFPVDVRGFVRLFRSEKPDIIHVNGAFFLQPAIAAKYAGIPLVWHLNDTAVPRPVALFLGRIVSSLADCTVVSAEAVARYYGVWRAPHHVIYAPVKSDNVPPHQRSIVGTNGLPRIGLLANWNPTKGIEYFLQAAAMVQQECGQIEVVLAGSRLTRQQEYAVKLDAQIKELCRERLHITSLGFVESPMKLLADLDVLVLSSLAEACPMAVLEGMAVGVPIVATDVGGIREMLLGDPERPAGIVVKPGDVERLACGIVTLLRDHRLAEMFAENGRKQAVQKFSLEQCVKRHLSAYRAVQKK